VRGCGLRAALSLLAAGLVAACAATRVETGLDDPDPRPVRMFAWSPVPVTMATADPDVPRDAEVQAAVELGFASQGLSLAGADDADVLVECEVSLATLERDNDPTYTFPIRERYETGMLTIDLLHPQTRERLWHGSASHRIRDVAHVSGVVGPRWVELSDPREWRLDELAARIAELVPRGEDG